MRFPLTIGLLIASLLSACSQPTAKRDFPDFHFMDSDSVMFAGKDIPADSGLLLMYFRSDCEHCHHASILMKEYVSQYPVTVWMVTGEDMSMMRMFEDMSGLYEIPNLRMLRDYEHNMHTWFDFTALPFIILFDKNGMELKRFEDLPAPDSLKQALSAG